MMIVPGACFIPIADAGIVTLCMNGNNFTDGGQGDSIGATVVLGFNGTSTVAISNAAYPYGTGSIDMPGNISAPYYGYVTTSNGPRGDLINDTDFSVELWFYIKSGETQGGLIKIGNLWIQLVASKIRILDWTGSGGTTPVYDNIATTTQTWTHLRLVRSGSTMTLYLDGISQGTATNSTLFSGDGALIGYDSNAGAFYGYLHGIRTIRGKALGSTVPTADFC